MPEVDEGSFWVGLMQSCGMCLWSDGRPVPLTFSEVDAWSRVAVMEISGMEAETMVLLSRHYCGSWVRALNPDCPDPCADESAAERTMQSFRNLVERYK